MSYDVSLECDGKTVQVDNHSEGGTYAVGGTEVADLNITYNYAEVYSLFDFNIRDLDGKRAGDTIETMARIVSKTGTAQYQRSVGIGSWEPDYWAPTPGNAGHALNMLLGWARQHPDAVWHVS